MTDEMEVEAIVSCIRGGSTFDAAERREMAIEILARLAALRPAGVVTSNGFDEWWSRDGQFIDPDTSDVPWFDKRRGLAEYAFGAGMAATSGEVLRCNICGFVVDTRYAAEKPSIAFEMRGRAKASPIIDAKVAGPVVKALDDAAIMEVIREAVPSKTEPQLRDLLTYEKSPPMFPQATYDAPTHQAVALVRAIEARILSALATPTAANASEGDGWKLVPIEPTLPMIDKGQWQSNHYPCVPEGYEEPPLDRLSVTQIYRAMLAAAPASPDTKERGRG